jgi:hypothetical protein
MVDRVEGAVRIFGGVRSLLIEHVTVSYCRLSFRWLIALASCDVTTALRLHNSTERLTL